MGKIRIYELAKQLNMTNKVLVQKLQEMGYPVKSHSSTVDESQVSEIKDRLEGRKSQVVVEKKIRATIIRRRKKIIEVPAEKTAAAEAKAVEPTEAAPSEPLETPLQEEPAVKAVGKPSLTETPATESALGEPVEASGEAAAEPSVEVEAPPVEELAEEAKPQPKIKKIKRPKGEPARIISRPKIVPPEAKPEEKPVPKPATPPEPLLEKPAPEPIVSLVLPEAETKKLKKKRKGKAEPETADEVKAVPKKPFRRKEIIERTELYDEEPMGRTRSARYRKIARAVKKTQKPAITVPKAIKRRIKIAEAITVAELAKRMGVKAQDVLRTLISLDIMANINQAIDYDDAELVASEFDYEVTKGAFDEKEVLHLVEPEEIEMTLRSPVVTVMGHVDHGKTLLLDTIRQTNIIEGEAGGITQHIGAYHVSFDEGNITFLDTPGHEAFTAMRARGAQVTDIVVLVVAADDGPMEQTREAIDHARAAGVPILVAINKIDKPEADPDRVKRNLSELGLVPEEWGGDTIFANVSAKTGQGITELLDLILLQAEVIELKAAPRGRAQGRVIEAHLDKGRGPVATILVQSGLLKPSDPFVCGVYYGKIRGMLNDSGRRLNQAGPSLPVEIQGISGVPGAGDEFLALENEKRAKQVSQYRQLKQRELELIKTSKVTLETIYERIKEGEAKEFNIVLKADVQGSLEAINDALSALSTDEIKINIIHSTTGAINETDVMLASASDASVIGFNVRPNAKVQELAESENIEIRYYDVIYKLTEEVKEAMVGLLEPTYVEETIGTAEVKQTFQVSKIGTVAGTAVTSGKIVRSAKVRLLRDGIVLFDGLMASLKRFKDDVKEVSSGYECGISLENFNDVKVGDMIEAYVIEEMSATL